MFNNLCHEEACISTDYLNWKAFSNFSAPHRISIAGEGFPLVFFFCRTNRLSSISTTLPRPMSLLICWNRTKEHITHKNVPVIVVLSVMLIAALDSREFLSWAVSSAVANRILNSLNQLSNAYFHLTLHHRLSVGVEFHFMSIVTGSNTRQNVTFLVK